MPVSISLNESKRDAFEKAIKAAKLEVKIVRSSIELTKENYLKVVEAVDKYHKKQVGFKTKTSLNLENAYAAQEILKQLHAVAIHFPASNDNVIGEVESPMEELTRLGEEMDADIKPSLDDSWFEKADGYIGDELVSKGADDAE